jgi:hypothetical protein
MPLLVPDVGEVELLSRMLNKGATGDVILRLYSNNYTPVEGATVASFTQCTAAGYAAKTLTGASWAVATNAGTTEASYAEQIFTFTAAQTVYGYYVTNSANTIALWAEIFTGAPFNIPSGGGSVKVTPKIQLA